MKRIICLTALLCVFPLSHCASPIVSDAVVSTDTAGTDVANDAPNDSNSAAEMTDAELKTLAENYVDTLKAINDQLEPSNIHGSRVKTFLDADAFAAYETKSFPYAAGSVSVKESHASESGPITRLYVMKKTPGYDPDNNDWFYAVMSTEGVASQKGKVQFCIDCHAGAKDKDYLFGFK